MLADRIVTGLRSWPLCAFFLIFLCRPTLDTVFKIDTGPQPNDNRKLAEWPDYPESAEDLLKYSSKLEAYFNDHFGFRRHMIRWHNRWKKNLFGEVSGADVMIGRGGWMYYSGAFMIENLSGSKPFDQAVLEKIRLELEARYRWLQKRGIAYVFAVAPNKESIYPEYLPDWLQGGLSAKPKLDQFFDFMHQNSDVPVVDVRRPLLAAKAAGPVYFLQDSHWNSLGAFAASSAIVAELRKQNPQLERPLGLDDIDVQIGQGGARTGDLARMIGLDGKHDVMAVKIIPKPPRTPLSVADAPLSSGETWSSGWQPVLTVNPRANFDALVFHDSFGYYLRPVFGWHFGRTQYIWISRRDETKVGMNWDAPRVLELRPNVVVDEMVERTLLNLTTETVFKTEFTN